MTAIDPKLLEDILERPLDDGPRLVAADALQEKGDPRGLFIVAECKLAERGLAPDERAALKTESAALLQKHGSAWAAAVRGSSIAHRMRRGFVDEVEGSAAELLKVAEELFAKEPVVRLNVRSASAEALSELAAAGAFARVVRLTVSGGVGPEGARALAGALTKRATPLSSLNLGGAGIGHEGVAALVPALQGCRALALTSNAIGDAGAAAIAKAKTSSSLETLFLTDNELTDEGLAALARSANLGALTRLGVARNWDVTEEGLAAIARSKKLRRLAWLEYADEDGNQNVAVRGRR